MARKRQRRRARPKPEPAPPAPPSAKPGIREQAGNVALAALLKIAAGRPVDPKGKPPTAGESLKAIERLRELGYGPAGLPDRTAPKAAAPGPEPPKRVTAAPQSNTTEAHAAPPTLPRPDNFTAREWTLVCAWLDNRNGQKTLEQAGRCVDPNSSYPKGIAWRTLQKPHVQAYIRAVRELEVAELGITRRTIAEGYQAIRDATAPKACRKVVVVNDVPQDGGIDSTALDVHRKATKDLSQHLGLEPAKKVEVALKTADDAQRELAGQLLALVGRVADDEE